jgi:tetratricopeptide (TPR) repeat protein
VTDSEGEQAVAAHPGIVEILREEGKGPSEAVWTAALEAAGIANDSEAVGRIGFRAHTDGNASTAARAGAMITAIDDPATEWLRQAAAFSRGRRDPTAEIPPRKRLLELTEAAYGPDHPEVAATLTNLGGAWRELGQPAKARELHERALRINEREFGPDHPQVAIILTSLGNAWTELGQPAKARELYERALRIFHAHFPGGHPTIDGLTRNMRAVAPDVIVLDDGRIVGRAERQDNSGP